MVYDVIIIGAGASGLFAASNIKTDRGLILEKTHRPGTKLLMSGSGQCNITHGGDIRDYITHYGEHGKKIRSCLYKHNNLELVEFLHSHGVETVTREDGKVFPESMKAADVLNLLLRLAESNGFDILRDTQVTGISQTGAESDSDGCLKVTTPRGTFTAMKLIIATGGCSYPTTGSDGSFFRILHNDLGLEITSLQPSLSPVNVYDYPYGELSGISFPRASVTHWRDGSKISQNQGDALLLTHRNFSGPLIINHSRYMKTGDIIRFNYIYPSDFREVLECITAAMDGNRSGIAGVTASLFNLPKNFAKAVCMRAGNKARAIAALLTEDEYVVKSVEGFKTAMATAGGISLLEVNPKTMELKKHPNIFAIGECLDVDGDTGGYNLQFAYSSARAAADAVLQG